MSIVGVSVVIGTILGAVAGFFGGWVDEVIMRVTDIFLAFPPLLLAMTVAAVLEPSLANAVLAITLTWWPWYTRLARAQAISVRERDFVKAARGIGVSDFTTIQRHITPNIITPILVQGTLDLGAAILTLAALSFLGLGVPPPTADWGSMVREGRAYIMGGRWWMGTFPGLALFLTTMAFNLLGDGLQLVTSPRARGEAQ
jgi:peptide/nickel transport system permease protein